MSVSKNREGTIIRNTTSCPYCGHRVKHENLEVHVRKQHPDDTQDEIFAKQLSQSGSENRRRITKILKGELPSPKVYVKCPVCDVKLRKKNLSRHLKKNHDTMEGRNSKVSAPKPNSSLSLGFSPFPPYRPELIKCPDCNAKVKPSNLDKHLRRVHPGVLPPGK